MLVPVDGDRIISDGPACGSWISPGHRCPLCPSPPRRPATLTRAPPTWFIPVTHYLPPSGPIEAEVGTELRAIE
jgi:hypothetical protein